MLCCLLTVVSQIKSPGSAVACDRVRSGPESAVEPIGEGFCASGTSSVGTVRVMRASIPEGSQTTFERQGQQCRHGLDVPAAGSPSIVPSCTGLHWLPNPNVNRRLQDFGISITFASLPKPSMERECHCHPITLSGSTPESSAS